MLKNKIRDNLKIVNYIMKSEKFNLLFVLTIVFSIYGGIFLSSSDLSFFDNAIIAFQYNIYNIFIFSLFVLNNNNFLNFFNYDFGFYIIRLKTKKNYIKEKIKFYIIYHSLYFIMLLLLFFSSSLIVRMHNIVFSEYYFYGISNYTYMIYLFIKLYLLSLLLGIVNIFVYDKFGKAISLIVNFVLIGGFMVTFTTIEQLGNLIYFLPWTFLEMFKYSSFMIEISYFLFYVIVLEIIIYVCYRLYIRKKKI